MHFKQGTHWQEIEKNFTHHQDHRRDSISMWYPSLSWKNLTHCSLYNPTCKSTGSEEITMYCTYCWICMKKEISSSSYHQGETHTREREATFTWPQSQGSGNVYGVLKDWDKSRLNNRSHSTSVSLVIRNQTGTTTVNCIWLNTVQHQGAVTGCKKTLVRCFYPLKVSNKQDNM